MTKILESISTKFACVDFLPQSQKYARVSLCCYVMESTFCPLATEDVQLHKRWCVSQHAHLSCKLCTDGMRFVRTKIIFLRNCENASFYRNCSFKLDVEKCNVSSCNDFSWCPVRPAVCLCIRLVISSAVLPSGSNCSDLSFPPRTGVIGDFPPQTRNSSHQPGSHIAHSDFFLSLFFCFFLTPWAFHRLNGQGLSDSHRVTWCLVRAYLWWLQHSGLNCCHFLVSLQ